MSRTTAIHIIQAAVFLAAVPFLLSQSLMAGPPKKGFVYNKTLHVSGDYDYPPFTYLDEKGKPQGLGVELIRRIAAKYGLNLEISLCNWSEALNRLRTGKTDIVLEILYTKSRKRYFDFTIPHTSEYYAIFVRSDSDIRNLEDLQGKELITLKGDASIERFLKPLGLMDAVTHSESLPLALEMLNSGRHDFVLAPYSIGMETIRKLNSRERTGARSRLKTIGPPIMPSLYRFAVHKGNYDLLQLLNEGIDELKSSGEMERISNRWLIRRKELNPQYVVKIAIFIIVPIVLIILILVLWSWTLKKEVRKKSEKLQEAIITADRANEAKSRFLAKMSHEIRTPLNTILGFSQILQSDSRNLALPAEFMRFIENIRVSGERLSLLIGKILDISKIEAGKMEVSRQDIDPVLLVREIFQSYKPRTLEKDIDFNFGYASDLPKRIRSDRAKLYQIISNLVDNAIKFTPEGKAIWLKLKRQADTIVVEIEDEGIGIPENRLSTVFKPFSQVEPAKIENAAGSGLGLAIVRELVELLGGSISLKSEPDGGTCATVVIPFVEASSETSEQPENNWDNVSFSRNNNVLVIEDSQRTQEMIGTFLRRFNLNVIATSSGQDGIKKALTMQPDLVLLDVHLPDLDGIAVVRGIKQHPDGRNIAVIVISADVQKDLKEAAMEAGALSFLPKPLHLDTLLPLMKQHLQQSRS